MSACQIKNRKQKFTPSPWKMSVESCGIRIEPNIAWIGDCSSFPQKEQLANARLIKIAPDMYRDIENTIETFWKINTAAVQICSNCPFDRKCKTCALSGILRLEIDAVARLQKTLNEANRNK